MAQPDTATDYSIDPLQRPGGWRLASAASAYLRAHKNDPVMWHPWHESLWKRAKTEGKPLFLSIGYVTCHWCHVMQRESFSDKKTAAWLNQYFIPVKVDRHLHPRLDRFFLQKVKEKLGYAGWPLNLFLSPKGEIIVATVYL
ncbi:DUF255 domain-containing protein, partial [Magnetococcales bacterium HHB-1]